ncbi:hypothetical protein [Tersicoccus sp. Bi-70]|uniref:hypothetical protein n=1 Tax=Tersicoccus sp. Bi-70 TaxID=1897634 RepID=UPI001E395E8E|nr:hypothetical protein [Tersicoccus sp. Bi-70]
MIGLLAMALGAVAMAGALVPAIAQQWSALSNAASTWVEDTLPTAPVGSTSTSWWTLGLIVVLLVVALLCLRWMIAQGGGRASTVTERTTPTDQHGWGGTTAVTARFAEDVLKTAFKEDPQILSDAVGARRTRRHTGLKVSLQAKKGASPASITQSANRALAELDAALGVQVPVLVRIRTGLRTAVGGADRVS